MIIQQFIKSLNNTELGKGNTHEYYVLVPSVIDINKLFDESNTNPEFYDLMSKSKRKDLAQLSVGRETRIKGLGPYYRENNVNAGDEIIFERRDENGKTDFFINLNRKPFCISFLKNTKGFEVLNMDRLEPKLVDGKYKSEVLFQGNKSRLIIEFKESSKKRQDSPAPTDFYDIKINDVTILSQYRNNEYIQLEINSNVSTLKKTIAWQQYKFNI